MQNFKIWGGHCQSDDVFTHLNPLTVLISFYQYLVENLIYTTDFLKKVV